ncbi:uncharacterized protein LOC116686313 [Etheostoma spectabile]|uniref:uncharacterized protein LOC116686313 n=1 Tax=Etheostoma spectabile TaxID=54343 RepID=UPI0013AF47A9|nr:uncharacterized protein LOC116686313 [Etheostoma spectabile]
MAFGFCLSVILLLSVWTTAKCDNIPNGVLHMECRDRYFMIAFLFYTGNEPSFEAVDETGVYPITKQYAAKCGYSVAVFPTSEHVELRASYFSCHTDNKEDEVFTFNFNLIVTHKGKEVTYALNKTCSPSLPWSPREVTCEINYMEVNGVPVEVVHATLFSRQSWVLVMVDLVAACSMHKGSHDNRGHIMWETPEVLHPLVSGHNQMQVNIGVNGELVEQPVAEKRGYIVKQHNSTVEISIPYEAEGGYRKVRRQGYFSLHMF